MATIEEFRQLAYECLRWADEAKTDEQREALRDMASWTEAASRLERVLGPDMVHGKTSHPGPREMP